MRFSRFASLLSLVLLADVSSAQEPGVAVNMGRGLDNGMGIGWTFKENWTLRPTLGLGYSDISGFQASVGSTVLRSFPIGDRVYAYFGAGVYYASGGAYVLNGGSMTGPGGAPLPNQAYNLAAQSQDLVYVTAPAGLRARIHGGFEAFVETAYQRALSGEFAPNQAGQFSGNPASRFGATLGISIRLQ